MSITSSRVFGMSLFLALCGQALAGDVLKINDLSLTDYKAATSSVQDNRPVALQRAVRVDGTWRTGVPFGLALAANASDPGAMGTTVADVDVSTGEASVYATHIALPSEGVTWTVGIAFNQMQNDGSAHDSNGYQGRNWFQISQPELIFYDDGTSADNDLVYIVFGNSYVEFDRDGVSSDVFRGVNGVAGAVEWVEDTSSEPDLYILRDGRGTKAVFFGFDGDAGNAAGQLWYIEDTAGTKAYVGDATTASTAISNGYNTDGSMSTAYDGNDRRYSYSYTTIDGTSRLTEVKAETRTGGTWASPTGLSTVAQVEYNYYESGDASGESSNNQGDDGNLQEVTVTMPSSDGTLNLVRVTHYRYWTAATSGDPYTLQYILDPEGARRLDWEADNNDNDFDGDYLTASETALKPYASAYFILDSSRRVTSTWRNGKCGCSGSGDNGTHTISYSSNASWSSSAGYTTGWKNRAIVTKPDASTVTMYVDELGQLLYRVVSDQDPANTDPPDPALYWVTGIERDSGGCVTQVRTPASNASYTHSTGSFTWNTTTGLIRSFVRETTGNLTGLVKETRWQIGTSGTTYLVSSQGYETASLTVGTGTTYDIVRPFVKWRWSYADSNVTTAKAESDLTTTAASKTVVAYTFNTGDASLVPQTVTSTQPIVSTGQNGSGAAVTTSSWLDASGRTVWQKSASGIIGYTGYENGRVAKRVQDADTSKTGTGQTFDGITIPTGFASDGSGDEMHRVSTFETDDLPGGVTTSSTGSASQSVVTILADRRIVQISVPLVTTTGVQPNETQHYWGPASYSVANHAGQIEFSATIVISGGSTTDNPDSWIDVDESDPLYAVYTTVGSLFRVSTSIYNESGAILQESRSYFNLPVSGQGDEGTDYDATRYIYNDLGKRVGIKDPAGTITHTVYDLISRPVASYIGTNDNDSSTFDVSFNTTGTSDMVKTSDTVYDGDSAGGNSLVTTTTAFVEDGTTDQRVTTFKYDERGRRLVTISPQPPHTFVELDNLGRTTYVGQYTSSSAIDVDPNDGDGVNYPSSLVTNRTALSKSNYDELGRVWKSQRYKIIQSTGATGVTIDSESWWDKDGRSIKQQGNQLTKTAYDRIGRATHQYVLAYTDDTAYADADDVTGDIVLEQTQTVYNDSDQVEMRVAISREHDDIGSGETTGGLDSNADTDDAKVTAADLAGRASISAFWYDDLGRTDTTAIYGTNSGSDFDRSTISKPTASSSSVLVTTVAYNDNGTQLNTEDAAGTKTQYEYDDAGRQTAVIANYVNGTPDNNAENDDDHYTRTVYTNGQRTKLWVDINGDNIEDADDQVTLYIYGVTKGTGAGDSKISSYSMLRAVVYPDSTNSATDSDGIDISDTDVVSYAYNAQGQQIYMKDQAGNITETTYDTAGRMTERAVTTLATGFDGAVRRIETAYNTRGFAETVTQYDAATAGSVVDEVKYDYDNWGPISKITQDHDSTVATGGTQYTVEYSYTRQAKSGARRALILDDMTLPDGTVVSYVSTNVIGYTWGDDTIGRVTKVKVGSVYVAEYDYLGLGRLVKTDLPEPDYFKTLSGSTNYDRLDRFGRITNDIWTADLATDQNLTNFTIAYDDNSNITSVEDSVHGDYGHVYTMDKRNRVIEAERGVVSGGTITTALWEQTWGLSQTGNWLTERLDLEADSSPEIDSTNTFTLANEWDDLDTESDLTVDFTMVYDAVGNLTDDDQNYEYVYDPFGRLRKVKTTGGSVLVAEYRYNGLNQRITTHFDTDVSGVVDGSDVVSHFAYDARWRMAARYEDADTSPTEQWVFHHAGLAESGGSSYIDSVILRDRDTSDPKDGVLDERVYYLQNWRADVVALIKDNGDQLEQVRYEPYGTPFGLPAGDIDSDGDFGSDDYAGIATTPYDVRKDVNMDGTISFADTTAAYNINGLQTLGRATPTSTKINNRKTYAAYEHLAELAGSKYDVRNRVLIAELGTWSRRDPLGYVDGMSLYQYVMSMPIMMVDEMAYHATAGASGGQPLYGNAPGSICDAGGGSSIAGVGSGCGGQAVAGTKPSYVCPGLIIYDPNPKVKRCRCKKTGKFVSCPDIVLPCPKKLIVKDWKGRCRCLIGGHLAKCGGTKGKVPGRKKPAYKIDPISTLWGIRQCAITYSDCLDKAEDDYAGYLRICAFQHSWAETKQCWKNADHAYWIDIGICVSEYSACGLRSLLPF